MRVQDIQSKMMVSADKMEAEPNSQIAEKKVNFRRQLTLLGKEEHKAYLDELRGQIEQAGARLSKKADVTELYKYRELVKKFMNEAVSNGYAFDKFDTMDARGRHRMFAVIKKIDVKLDELTKEVLSEQKDNITILDKIDDIRGLLVDLML